MMNLASEGIRSREAIWTKTTTTSSLVRFAKTLFQELPSLTLPYRT